jgi:asparagine synthase (glutamine-hydrolysing)
MHTEGSTTLGHARLSIIDPTGGRQPMSNEDKSLWITFNGEIYNYVELRKELIRDGHRFSTESDTEVILHLYEQHGEDCVHRMNGQWAFAVWDSSRRRLFLSRDRVGIRPLFYARTADAFVFASEIKSILAYPGVRREIDLRALAQIFTLWVTLPPRTAFRGVRELPPGHSLVVAGEELHVKPYWRLDFSSGCEDMSRDDYAERLLELLTDATRLRLRADVPVGAYLSGGLDSSVITALVKRVANDRLRTFSVTFEDHEFDESAHQRDVIASLQTEHQEVRCSYSDIGRAFPETIWNTEKPVLRTAPAPLYLLSELVRNNGYKVVLTGEGADEILGGYDIFKESKIRRFWAVEPGSRFRALLLRRLYPYMPSLQAQPDAYLRAAFRVSPETLDSPFFSHLPRWQVTSQTKMFFSMDVRREIDDYSGIEDLESMLPPGFSGWDKFCQAQYLETAYLLPGYILSSQGDRMSMGHSVEGRFPFLDHRVIDFAGKIPPRWKMRGLNEKYVLKRAARDLVPSSVIRRKKQPFRAPDVKSFFDPATGKPRQEYVDDLLCEKRVNEFGLFSSKAVGRLVEKAKSGRVIGARDNMALVGILSTQLVVDRFVNNL